MSVNSQRLLTVVVIGLNEQDRLKECLEAVFACSPAGYDLEVLYVDSGSTDRSVEIASAVAGVEVLHLNTAQRSAARARNLGLRRARGQYVQLVDGDCVVQAGWMDAALAVLEKTPEISCVFGQCVEMYPKQSIYMRTCGLNWYVAPGDYRFCGGNSMWRMSIIAANGYFDEDISFGEEPDLCYRVRQRGGRILCIDVPMVTHDLGMLRFDQYWRRAVNSGRAYATVAARYWRNPEKLWLRETLLNFAEPCAWMVILAIGWHVAGGAGGAALLIVWWLARATQIAYAIRTRKVTFPEALLYGLHCQFVRLPGAIGQLKTMFGSR
jgi:glycosyltransferase involved in cell wall biosynthesis